MFEKRDEAFASSNGHVKDSMDERQFHGDAGWRKGIFSCLHYRPTFSEVCCVRDRVLCWCKSIGNAPLGEAAKEKHAIKLQRDHFVMGE